jgi:hypothetical protein
VRARPVRIGVADQIKKILGTGPRSPRPPPVTRREAGRPEIWVAVWPLNYFEVARWQQTGSTRTETAQLG